MKVLYLSITSEIGGADLALLRTVTELDRAEFQPVVAVPGPGPLVEAYQAAGAEYRMVRIQESTRRTQSGPWVSMNEQWPYDDQVEVSPPPFRSGGKASSMFVKPIRAQHDLFDDLFQQWK